MGTNCPALKEKPCKGLTCEECQTLQARWREDKEMADKLKDFWKCQQAGME